MSPRALWPILVALLSYPTAVVSMEGNVPAAPATLPPTSNEMVREARNDGAQINRAVLVGKDFHIDVSREPRPLTYGPFKLAAFHVFPTQVPGPSIGPPTKLWDSGFGTSLWRNAVTGWPEL
jgi:hypothetical protein